MRFFAIIAAALVPIAAAETFTVLVGQNSGLTYSPNTYGAFVTAQAGDTINFQFLSKNHTVTQSTFAAPCTPLANGVDSGFQFVATNATAFPQYSITIQNGMVFAVNPTATKTFAAFQATAMGASANSTNSTGSSSASATSGSATTTSTPNSARMVSGNTAAILATLGLVAGLVL
ncbi:hypothetical protein H0H93_012432 [Arthromyces matolae]|nr:hypothetical protein H0H93_012432 [Arthromyces matolae]